MSNLLQIFSSVQSKGENLILVYVCMNFREKYTLKTCLQRQQTKTAEFKMQLFSSVQSKIKIWLLHMSKYIPVWI